MLHINPFHPNPILRDHLPDHPFWRFVTKIREYTPTQDALHYLQHHSEFHLHLFLFCCWYASSGQGKLVKTDILQLISISASWSERIILPLQQLKNKHLPETIKRDIIADLQLAEQIELLMLTDVPIKFSRAARNSLQKLSDACKNIAVYCKSINIAIDAVLQLVVNQILLFCFPKLEPAEIQRAIELHIKEGKSGSVQGKLELD